MRWKTLPYLDLSINYRFSIIINNPIPAPSTTPIRAPIAIFPTATPISDPIATPIPAPNAITTPLEFFSHFGELSFFYLRLCILSLFKITTIIKQNNYDVFILNSMDFYFRNYWIAPFCSFR